MLHADSCCGLQVPKVLCDYQDCITVEEVFGAAQTESEGGSGSDSDAVMRAGLFICLCLIVSLCRIVGGGEQISR